MGPSNGLHRMEPFEGKDVVCDVSAITKPDATTVDFLARVHLFWRRLGRHLRIVEAPRDLEDLVCLMGLSEVLAVESRRKTEEREEVLGVEEEADP